MIEQALCPNEFCRGRGYYTLGPHPATKCNTCGGKGYIMVEADPVRAAAHELYSALDKLLPADWRDGTMDHMPGVKEAREALARAKLRG